MPFFSLAKEESFDFECYTLNRQQEGVCSLGEIGDLGMCFSFNCAALGMITAAYVKSEVNSMGRIMQSKDRGCGHNTFTYAPPKVTKYQVY